jgi:hypothetical protein
MPITTTTTGTQTTFVPAEILYDPTNKLRVAQPESLIDTDFEYGTQTTKWENLATVNNVPFAYPNANAIANIVSMQFVANSRQVIVTLGSGTAPANGTPIYVQDSLLTPANGNFIIETGGGTTVFTYKARSTNNTSFTAIFDANKTLMYQATHYSNATIAPQGSYIVTTSGKIVTVTCATPHGLAIGNEIIVTGITGTNPPNGAYEVCTITAPTIFSYAVDYNAGTPSGLTVTSMDLYVRPSAQFLHRPFDGGVIFSSNGNSNYETAVRQTRRYFRYQSGKGLQISSGTILKPSLQVDAITAVGTVGTVSTKERHNLWTGAQVTISGVSNDTTYNGTFTVASVISYNTFTITLASTPTVLTAQGPFIVSVVAWYGAINRLGLFDDQNGVFFEFDGQQLYAVRRTSTYQLPGRYTVTAGSDQVTRTSVTFPTASLTQLVPNDFVVIRGSSYRVLGITDDNTFTISPSYRGATASMVQITRTVDTKIPQSSWNIDKMDGTGTSGYNIDLSKMQMFYIDYTWYGAGAIRWGFRATDGQVTYCHRLANNNINAEAYMRSGNLPARYETSMQPPFTRLAATLGSADGTMTVVSTSAFPSSGVLLVRNNTTTEYVTYTGKTATTFTGLTRSGAGIPAGVSSTVASGQNLITVASTANLRVGQKVYDLTNGYVPEGGYIQAINSATTFTLSVAVTGANPTLTIPPMDTGSPFAFTFTALTGAPILVELSQPTYAPTISHWGTSVIMDGRFDEDKSLIFTYGQTTTTTIAAGATRALMSIRVAPSADNGIGAAFGVRDLINRMQLKMDSIGVTTATASANYLVTAVINGIPSSATSWTSPTGNSTVLTNSSLAQIADYAGGTTTITGGEVTGGFLSQGTDRQDLTLLRDLGNSIMGGGTTLANQQIFPNGPDVLTFLVTNLSGASITVAGRISWKEAQA